ncbi:MAG TPA: siderophore synthetase phosphopantetheinyl transferase subunit [Alistipes sp.]|uniref:4'-phosphopantetheinyl transferase family protein n=1 Tax=Alistipes sp. UBA6068 TaxID=1946012 RepID=UPI000E882C0F|nr:4'-phosphopantetheinyl transferase superfamily protein [Alistipes sp. UBA6068]HBV50307.1 siderophore synthetase phosphopantetheinyl transferase subunit [Alistipes sp.]
MFRLFVERPMSASDAAPWATPDELASAAAFPPARQAEWLSWRAIVRREVCREFGCRPAEIAIAYNETGAPVVEGAAVHAAVSHCRGSVAVGLSDAPCAVDIESLDRNFGRIASRYMTSTEQALSDDPRWPAVVWSAKETLYKYAGRKELDLLCDLRVEQADFSAGRLVGRIRGGEVLLLRFLFFAGRVIVFLS